jgi:anaerobic selenocysteine-containing dehydrogenase
LSRVVRTTCGICQIGCGVLVHLDGDRVVHIEGDPENPLNRGVLCPKGNASLEYLYSSERIMRPLVRSGARGEGKWEFASWDKALTIVADRLSGIKDKYGPESVAFVRGAAKGVQDEYFVRFANLFGSPNFVSMGYLCYMPRRNASLMSYGFMAIPDFENRPACAIIWGENLSDTLHHMHRRMKEAMSEGMKLIVVDPYKSRAASEADLWLQLKPGTDLALALGIIHVMIQENLYDRAFVEAWTVGFDDVVEAVKECTPERTADRTGLTPEIIREAARLYGRSRPSVIQWGNGIDHTADNFQTARALCIMRSISGNVGRPGGELRWLEPPLIPKGSAAFSLHDRIQPDVRNRRITGGHKMLPSVFYALQAPVMDAILSGEPYQVRAAFVQGCNPLLSVPNSRKIRSALEDLDFLVVSDQFMTPVGALADVVLPSVTYLEFDSIVAPPYSDSVVCVQQRVARTGESRSDYEILRDLARKLGIGKDFWDREEEALDFLLKPVGITFSEFRTIGFLRGTKLYREHERTGFPTPSKKIELFSERLEECGLDPVPLYRDKGARPSPQYPIHFTSWKRAAFRHSGGRQIPSLRSLNPEPLVTIHPDTARAHGIADGDGVFIVTPLGRIVQKACIDDGIRPDVVGVDFGWWFPEKKESVQFDWDKANVNILIDDDLPWSEMGTPNVRGLPCRIEKKAADE